MISPPEQPFRVIIAGGGIAGLALANALQVAGIDSLLLEAYHEVAPHVGASIGLYPNGGRILDQLDVYDDILELAEPATNLEAWRDGRLLERSDFIRSAAIRHGYPFFLLERYHVIQALYKHVPDKSKLLYGKRISRVDHFDDRVIVQCKDGSSYTGDIVIGADGVHSIVRQEMWRHANLASPGLIAPGQEKVLTAEYRCLWAMSNPVPGTVAGSVYKIYGKDTSFLMITGKDNRAYWFIFDKLDKVYHVPNIPKFTQADAEALVQKHLRTKLTDQVCVEDLWRRRISSCLVPIEEGLFEKWTWGRFACIGDSAHKMTPNIGQGGNTAIESAASVANVIHEMLAQKRSSKPSTKEIERALKSYQESRQERVEKILKLANKVTRFEALKGPVEEFLSMHVFPHIGGLLQDQFSAYEVAAEKLNFLPESDRALKATMPFDQNYEKGKHDKLLTRSLKALPLLAFVILGAYIPTGASLSPTSTTWSFAEVLPLILIWIFESHRHANFCTFASIPILFALSLLKHDMTIVVAAYAFFHYAQSPLSKMAAKDQRMINLSSASTALASLGVGVAAWYLLPNQQVSAMWIPFLSIAAQSVLSRCVEDTTAQARWDQPTSDLPAVRFAAKVVACVAALVFNYQRFSQGTAMVMPLVPAMILLTWTWLLFEDLRIAKVTNTSRLSVFSAMALGSVVVGPGAVSCAMWLWREELLASR